MGEDVVFGDFLVVVGVDFFDLVGDLGVDIDVGGCL